MSGISLRARLTLAFALGMTVVSLGVASFVYSQVRNDLRSEVDLGLRARAQALIAAADTVHRLPRSSGRLADNDESFAQLLSADGRVIAATRSVSARPLLAPSELGHARPWFHDGTPAGLEPARLLEVPTTVGGRRTYLVVGATLSDTREALTRLLEVFLIALPVALLVASIGGWLLAGAALRPLRRMSLEAAAIGDVQPEGRLAVPRGDPMLTSLATTLNETFDRLRAAIHRERTFSANASHELRTPLTILKAEVDSALSSPRTELELRAALESAIMQIRHLVAITERLLAMARSSESGLRVDRTATALRVLVAERAAAFRTLAAGLRIEIVEEADDVICDLDSTAVRQALDNLLDNALRHTPEGGRVVVRAVAQGGMVSICVEDDGPGFSDESLAATFQPFNRAASNPSGAGLGLALANAIAEAHGGHAEAGNRPAGGATVSLLMPSSVSAR